MKKLFEDATARQLINGYRDILQKYASEVSVCRDWQFNKKIFEKLKNNNIFETFCSKELTIGNNLIYSFPDLISFLTHIYVVMRSKEIIQNCSQVFNKVGYSAMNVFYDLEAGIGGVWLFKSSSVKTKANDAYKYIKSDYFVQSINYISLGLQQLLELHQVSAEIVVKDYYAHISDYEKYVFSCVGNVYFQNRRISSIERLVSVYDELTSNVNAIIKNDKLYVENIRDTAKIYIENKTIEKLIDIPIESLKIKGDGLKVSVLQKNGINNAKELYLKRGALDLYPGIGYATSEASRKIAHEIYNDVKQNIRIKLNYDDRTIESIELIRALYRYINYKTLKNECLNDFKNFNSKIVPSYQQIKNLKNGLNWLFYSPEKKIQIRQDYLLLINSIQGDLYKELLNDVERSNSIHRASEKTIFDDFKNNTIKYVSVLEELCEDILPHKEMLDSSINDEDFEEKIYGLPVELANQIDIENPSLIGLRCELRKYQSWGVKFILHQKKVLLGDEMGLGKTIQAIASIIAIRNEGATHFLVVCPASVLQNWTEELLEKSDLKVIQIYGASKFFDFEHWIKTGGVAVTTYESLNKLPIFEKIDMMVVDEAHYIKNPDAQRTKNVKRFVKYSTFTLFMTGTALENRTEEMISLTKVLNEEIGDKLESIKYSPNQFKNTIMPVYYRRKREDVLNELPELIESYEWCQMTEEDMGEYYKTVLSKNFMSMRRVSWNVDDLNYSSKATRVSEIIEEATEDDRKIIIFSFFLDTLNKLHEYYGDRSLQPINGSVPPSQRQEIIKSFDKAPSGTILLAQIQTGGTGLNIQSASVVIICEPQYKPSTENQAISRAYRMGQNRNVLVYRMLCINTIEKRITEILKNKQNIFDNYADESYSAIIDAEKMKEEEGITDKQFKLLAEEEYNRVSKLVYGQQLESK